MKLSPLAFRSPLSAYELQARHLLDSFRSGDRDVVDIVWHKHPRFLRDDVPWAAQPLTCQQVQQAPFDEFDARLTLARWYDFENWRWLRSWVLAVADPASPVTWFESAVEAVVAGDLTSLRALLSAHPELVRARSTRVAPFDPPQHRATLLHYVAANGVEGYREVSPPNAVEVARALLDAGAEVDALADMYGGKCTTMSMLVSSGHPYNAGLQTTLAETLLDYGAALDNCGQGRWTSPLITALVVGYRDTAEMLARRGARVDTVAAAAGLGRVDEVRRMLPPADADDRHRGLALATLVGHTTIVRLLLDAGEDPSRYNPPGFHGHGTPLHHAVWAGKLDVVKLLVERGARLDIKDKLWSGTPLDWAEYGRKTEMVGYLRAIAAPIS